MSQIIDDVLDDPAQFRGSGGRVGDSAIVGDGTCADGRGGAVSCTGHGENILRVTLARWTVARLVEGWTAQEAATGAMAELGRVEGRGGVIVVDRNGSCGFACNTPRMARGRASREGGTAGRGRRRPGDGLKDEETVL